MKTPHCQVKTLIDSKQGFYVGFKAVFFALILISFFSVRAGASATNIYLGQTAVGAANGADCNDTYAYSFFNSSGNWGGGSNQIGPGTTVHICGTISLPGGSNAFTFQGSGTNGNPVTLLFESGAVLSAPYWGSGIYSLGDSYITINGGSNGIIQATLNGSAGGTCPGGPCTFQQASNGVYLNGCAHCTIENLSVSNIYTRSSSTDESSGAQGAVCLQIYNSSSPSIAATSNTITGNIVHDCLIGISYGWAPGDSGVTVSNNQSYNANWSMFFACAQSNAGLTSASIYNNAFHDWRNWDDSAGNDFHHNGFFTITASGCSESGVLLYNNYFYGDTGADVTGMIHTASESGNANAGLSMEIFNNLVALTATTGLNGGNGAITEEANASSPTTLGIYNNTFAGVGTMYGMVLGQLNSGNASFNNDIRNNIVYNWATAFYTASGSALPQSMDYNDWNASVGGNGMWDNNGTGYSALPSWTAATGLDHNSTVGRPNLVMPSVASVLQAATAAPGTVVTISTSILPSGSAAMGTGVNLTSLGIAALNKDKNGVPRPTQGSWDMGAFYSGAVAAPAPPTSVQAIVE